MSVNVSILGIHYRYSTPPPKWGSSPALFFKKINTSGDIAAVL